MIAATAQCLAELGVAGTSVREVAARAGVSAGLIRHHFGSMDQLILDTYRFVGERVSAAIDGAIAAAGDDPYARLDAFLEANFRPPILDADLLSTWLAFWSLVRRDPRVRQVHAEIYAGNRAQLETILAAIAEARGRPLDTRLTGIAITALVDGLWLEHCLDSTTFSPAEAVEIARSFARVVLG
nr:TetR family transcriptional regulator C-terminal domain-containing protein [Chthonobacter albigriseus]